MAKAAHAPDTLQVASLDWAKAHIKRFGDTDLFPLPFEYECLWSSWDFIRPHICELELSTVPPSSSRTLFVPKPSGGFRAATQLDPLDGLIYAALAFEAAAPVETSRVAPEQFVACSYRLAPSEKGQLFEGSADGWASFHSQSKSLANKKSCTHVVIADISDFYNQIYHHRLQNSLSSAGIPDPRPENIEKFLGRITAKQSRGIPVGPAASILFAESCLNDVDRRLISCHYKHVRYVDDFRIFCKSEREAVGALHELSRYLFTAHRLSLQAHKTRILTKSDFRKRELIAPEEREAKSKEKHARKAVEEAFEAAGPYAEMLFDPDEVLLDRKNEIAHKALLETYRWCLKHTPIHLGLARYVLRKAGQLGTGVLVKETLNNLHELTPVFREAVLYLDKVWDTSMKGAASTSLQRFLKDSPQGWLPYLHDWSIWLVTKRDLLPTAKAIALAERATDFSIRYRALLAQKYQQAEWVREKKEAWRNFGPWDRRAILWAGSVLPRDERRHWLEPVTTGADVIEAAIAKHVRALP